MALTTPDKQLPYLALQKEPALTMQELYIKYPDGGQFGWYAFVKEIGSFAYWDVESKSWKGDKALVFKEEAETARDAALQAQEDAEKAKDDAVIAKGQAQEAQTAAEGFAGDAFQSMELSEQAKVAAETAQGKSEDAQIASETAKGLSETARDQSVAARNEAVNLVSQVGLGTPKSTFTALVDLQTADPDHQYIYLVISDGHWYYWDETEEEWADGGAYQAALDVVGELGGSETKVVNQKTVTDSLINIERKSSGIYSEIATGVNIPKIAPAVKDLIIENPIAGKYYTLTSVEIPASPSGTYILSIFQSDSPTSAVNQRVLVFSYTNPCNGKVNYYKKTDALGWTAHILVKWEDFTTPGIYSGMWHNNYALKSTCFQDGNSTNFILDNILRRWGNANVVQTAYSIYKDISNIDTTPKSILNSAIKEIYVEGGPIENDLALSVVQRGVELTAGVKTWCIRLYEIPGNILRSEFLTTINPETSGNQLIALTGSKKGYVLINWAAMADGANYNSLVAPTNFISSKCYDLTKNPNINILTTTESLKIAQQISKEKNAIRDPFFINREAWLNKELNTQIAILQGCTGGIKTINEETVAYSYRTSTGSVSGLTFLINPNSFKGYGIGDWMKVGAFVRCKMPTTGTYSTNRMSTADKFVESGVSINLRTVFFAHNSTEWKWVELNVPIENNLYQKAFQLRAEFTGVTDYSEENTFGIEVKSPMIVFYKNGTVPANPTGFQNNIYDTLKVQNDDLNVNTLFSKILKIGNYNNSFSIDELDLGKISSYILSLKENYEVPTDGAYLSTDVDNAVERSNPPTYAQLQKALVPYLYINGIKSGTIVLFDENNDPFIYNKSGVKLKLITE